MVMGSLAKARIDPTRRPHSGRKLIEQSTNPPPLPVELLQLIVKEVPLVYSFDSYRDTCALLRTSSTFRNIVEMENPSVMDHLRLLEKLLVSADDLKEKYWMDTLEPAHHAKIVKLLSSKTRERLVKMVLSMNNAQAIASLGTELEHLSEEQRTALVHAAFKLKPLDKTIAIIGLTARLENLNPELRDKLIDASIAPPRASPWLSSNWEQN